MSILRRHHDRLFDAFCVFAEVRLVHTLSAIEVRLAGEAFDKATGAHEMERFLRAYALLVELRKVARCEDPPNAPPTTAANGPVADVTAPWDVVNWVIGGNDEDPRGRA